MIGKRELIWIKYKNNTYDMMLINVSAECELSNSMMSKSMESMNLGGNGGKQITKAKAQRTRQFVYRSSVSNETCVSGDEPRRTESLDPFLT